MPTRHAVLPRPVDSLHPLVVNDPTAPDAGDFGRLSVSTWHVPTGVSSSTPSAGGVDLESVDEAATEPAGAAALVLEERFSIVPEWVLDAEVSDAAVRLYAVLLRYGQSSGQRMPSRRTLAARLRKRSVDSVDRALKELVALGAVEVTRRSRGGLSLTNRYLVRSTRPGRPRPGRPRPDRAGGGGRTDAATPDTAASTRRPGHVRGRHHGQGSGRMAAAGGSRTDAAEVAARMRPDPESLTENQPPPPPPSAQLGTPLTTPEATEAAREMWSLDREARRQQVVAMLGVSDLTDVADRCVALRRQRGLPTGLWTPQRLTDVVVDAVMAHEFPATAVVPALLALAADPATRSPARLRCPGPWWDIPPDDGGRRDAGSPNEAAGEVANLEAVLAEVGGLRVVLQRQARAQLAAEGLPVTRDTVARRAVDLLNAQPSRDEWTEVGSGHGASAMILRS